MFDEQVAYSIIGMSICEREVQGPLHLSAELPRLAFGLPARRQTIGCTPTQRLGEFWIYEI
jgi:hypothetical protein